MGFVYAPNMSSMTFTKIFVEAKLPRKEKNLSQLSAIRNGLSTVKLAYGLFSRTVGSCGGPPHAPPVHSPSVLVWVSFTAMQDRLLSDISGLKCEFQVHRYRHFCTVRVFESKQNCFLPRDSSKKCSTFRPIMGNWKFWVSITKKFCFVNTSFGALFNLWGILRIRQISRAYYFYLGLRPQIDSMPSADCRDLGGFAPNVTSGVHICCDVTLT